MNDHCYHCAHDCPGGDTDYPTYGHESMNGDRIVTMWWDKCPACTERDKIAAWMDRISSPDIQGTFDAVIIRLVKMDVEQGLYLSKKQYDAPLWWKVWRKFGGKR